MYWALGDIVFSIVSNSYFGKRSGARYMTIFGSHVGPLIPNIDYFKVYEDIQRYMEVYKSIRGYMKGRYMDGYRYPYMHGLL